jgi:hypothetical protein
VTTINAGGGDWLDLPTAPIRYRGARKTEGLDWSRIRDQYIANNGQVDAAVWHQGKVQVVEGGGRGKDRVHTYAERGGYQEPTAPAKQPKKRAAKQTEPATPKRSLTDEQRAEITQRYLAGENIPGLAVAYGVGVGSVAWALRHIKTRSHAEGRAIAKQQKAQAAS